MDTESPVVWPHWCYSGETTGTTTDPLDNTQSTKSSSRRRRMERSITNNNCPTSTPLTVSDFALNNNNNNNHVKNERLSPGTPDTSSRSRSVTPSSATDTPPAAETTPLIIGRNYSDIMRNLAAKYNNANPNDYFHAVRNGFPPPMDPRFKPTFHSILPQPSNNKESDSGSGKKSDFSVLGPFMGAASMFPPLIDMSTTQTLLAMVRTAKEAELQGLLKNVKRPDSSSPLDLSAAAPPPTKRLRIKTPTLNSPSNVQSGNVGPVVAKRSPSQSPRLHHAEDITSWTVDDVCNFVSTIDICAEYAQIFREQSIDGSGLPMLTEEHLTTKMNMKLGPALKLRSILAKKMGSCSVCLHCTHCHNSNSGSPEVAGSSSTDSGGGAS